MNDYVRKRFSETGLSKRAFSLQVGIPYSTVSEILNEKQDINKCTGENIQKIALFFDCRMEDLLNRFYLMDGVHGSYKDIPYVWQLNESTQTMRLTFTYDGESVVRDTQYKLNVPHRISSVNVIAEFMIDDYLDDLYLEHVAKGAV